MSSSLFLLLLVIEATDLSLRAVKCCSVVFGILLKLLVINISSSFPAISKLRRLLPAMCHNLWDHGLAIHFGVEKLEWLGYPMVKNFVDMFIHFNRIQERDRHRMTTYATLA